MDKGRITKYKPVTVTEARKILGKASEAYTDEEIQELLTDLMTIANLYLEAVPKS